MGDFLVVSLPEPIRLNQDRELYLDTSARKPTRTKSLERTHSKGLLRFLSCSLSPLGTVVYLESVCI